MACSKCWSQSERMDSWLVERLLWACRLALLPSSQLRTWWYDSKKIWQGNELWTFLNGEKDIFVRQVRPNESFTQLTASHQTSLIPCLLIRRTTTNVSPQVLPASPRLIPIWLSTLDMEWRSKSCTTVYLASGYASIHNELHVIEE